MKTIANQKEEIVFQVALHAVIMVLAFTQGLGLGWFTYRAEPSMIVKGHTGKLEMNRKFGRCLL